ncbi:hypothetical protein OZX60_03685 [Streptococcaceae bacterium ESL0687]|nr:hypothetical protein OZX60_03685 [Streptococcaceae bacterium ESL0687]
MHSILVNFYQLFMTFMVYSIIGWVWESIYCSLKAGHFVYRGYLLGPYCPVYGFGITASLLLIPKNFRSPFELYVYSAIIVTIIEYLASYLLEKVAHLRLWDYSKLPFNIKGRVALPISLFWGLGCLLLIDYIEPFIGKYITKFIYQTHFIGPFLLLIIILADAISTYSFTHSFEYQLADREEDKDDKENAGIKEWRLKNIFYKHQENIKHRKLVLYLKGLKGFKNKSLYRLAKNYPSIKFISKKVKEKKES